MIYPTRFVQVLVLTVSLPLAAAAQEPDTVTLADLTIAGLRYDSDTGATRLKLGPPSRAEVADQPNDDGVILTTWFYAGLRLDFAPNGHRYTAIVRAPRYRTRRGVAVGDSAAKVRRLYGRPMHDDAGGILYAASTKEFEPLGITFFIKDGRVSEIILGEVISVE